MSVSWKTVNTLKIKSNNFRNQKVIVFLPQFLSLSNPLVVNWNISLNGTSHQSVGTWSNYPGPKLRSWRVPFGDCPTLELTYSEVLWLPLVLAGFNILWERLIYFRSGVLVLFNGSRPWKCVNFHEKQRTIPVFTVRRGCPFQVLRACH